MNTPLQRIFVYGNYINLYEKYPYFPSGQFLFQNAKSFQRFVNYVQGMFGQCVLKLCINCSNLEGSYCFTWPVIMVSSLPKSIVI